METQELTIVLPAAIAGAVLAVRQIVVIIAKTIPDSATGWRAGLRRLCKVLALYVPNQQ